MVCLLTLLVVAALALFSARHRPLAREALDCVRSLYPYNTLGEVQAFCEAFESLRRVLA